MLRPSPLPCLDHLIIFSEEYKLWCSLLSNFLHPSVISSNSDPKIHVGRGTYIPVVVYIVYIKAKLSLSFITHYAMKTYVGVVSFTCRPLYHRGKSPPPYPLDRRLGGTQSNGPYDMENRKSCPCRKSNPGRPACSPSLNRHTIFIIYTIMTRFVYPRLNCAIGVKLHV
jgi:hypothetical protein